MSRDILETVASPDVITVSSGSESEDEDERHSAVSGTCSAVLILIREGVQEDSAVLLQ